MDGRRDDRPGLAVRRDPSLTGDQLDVNYCRSESELDRRLAGWSPNKHGSAANDRVKIFVGRVS